MNFSNMKIMLFHLKFHKMGSLEKDKNLISLLVFWVFVTLRAKNLLLMQKYWMDQLLYSYLVPEDVKLLMIISVMSFCPMSQSSSFQVKDWT